MDPVLFRHRYRLYQFLHFCIGHRVKSIVGIRALAMQIIFYQSSQPY